MADQLGMAGTRADVQGGAVMSELEEVVSKARVGAMLVGNLPELPGYNGSRLIIDDIEAERVSADVYAALEALQSRIKELEAAVRAAIDDRDYLLGFASKHRDELESSLAAAVAAREAGLQDRWIIVKECAVTLRQGERPLLAYASLPNSAIYGSEDEVRDAIVAANTELGWVMCRMSQVFAIVVRKEQP